MDRRSVFGVLFGLLLAPWRVFSQPVVPDGVERLYHVSSYYSGDDVNWNEGGVITRHAFKKNLTVVVDLKTTPTEQTVREGKCEPLPDHVQWIMQNVKPTEINGEHLHWDLA